MHRVRYFCHSVFCYCSVLSMLYRPNSLSLSTPWVHAYIIYGWIAFYCTVLYFPTDSKQLKYRRSPQSVKRDEFIYQFAIIIMIVCVKRLRGPCLPECSEVSSMCTASISCDGVLTDGGDVAAGCCCCCCC